MNRTAQKSVSYSAIFLFVSALVGGVLAATPAPQLTREDIKSAIEHGSAIVEAQVDAGERNAVGTRSEGHGYRIRLLSVLLPATAKVSTSFTYDYNKTPLLQPGRYVIILQPGPYYRAERLSPGPARLTEIRQWTQRQ